MKFSKFYYAPKTRYFPKGFREDPTEISREEFLHEVGAYNWKVIIEVDAVTFYPIEDEGGFQDAGFAFRWEGTI